MKSENNDDNKNAENRKFPQAVPEEPQQDKRNAGSRTRQYRGGNNSKTVRTSPSAQQQRKQQPVAL